MNALNIVMISVLGSILLIFSLGMIILHALQENRAHNLNILNRFSEKGQIVFFGDSLTDFFPVQEFFSGLHIYNRGIANDKTTDLIKRINNVTDIAPSKLFLLIGTNDLGVRVPLEKIMQNIHEIIELIKKDNPTVKIHLISQAPINRRAKFFTSFFCLFRTNTKLLALSMLEKNYCEKHGYTFIDVWDCLIDSRGNLKKEYTVEGLHLSMSGYRVMAKILKPYVLDEVQ
ncbi:MAG TPA: GDSL-type esterase/lipase family protein [Clostridia bacterium]|nr:GDSL-type esterase/lipase family protein [Clostridia bacterium]